MSFVSECWRRRSQIWFLAVTELKKTCRGAVLGWAWLFIKPAVYVFVFWFALSLGLRAGGEATECPYIVWLTCGLVPWFFMQDMLGAGSNVYRRYAYLVNKVGFPMPAISAFYVLSKLIVYVVSFAILLGACAVGGVSVPPTVVQLPIIAMLMYLFFVGWSMLASPLSALSKDFSNLIKTLSTPLFWVSGIIYDVSALGIDWIQSVLAFNPVTFFAQAHRMALCDGVWLWEDPFMLGAFAFVLVLVLGAAVLNLRRVESEVTDVL